jgi:hypothetical protein
MKNLKTAAAAPAPAPAPPSSGTKKEGILKKKQNGEKKEPSDFDLFVLVYAFLQTNDYGEAAEKMMREMKRRLRKEMNSMGGENDENDDFDEKNKKEKNNNNNKTKVMRKKKLVQMLNGLGKGAKNATTTTVTSTSEQQSSPSPLVRLLPRVKPLRAIMSEFLTMKAKERRRKKSTNEPMKMIFRQCEEAFGNLRKEEVDDDEEEEEEDDDDDGREGVVDILAGGEDARGNGRKRRREDEDIDAAEALALAAARANPLQEEEEENNNNNNNNDDDATAAHTNNTNATGERRNKKKQAAPQRKHKQTIYKQSLDDANVREKIADVIVRTLHKKTGRTPNPTPTMTNSAKRNKNVEREELAFSDVEEDEEDDEFGHHRVTELELDKIAELMEKPEDTMETANAILGSLMESTDNDLGRFLEDLVAQTEHGNTKEINKLPTPKKRLLLKEDQKAANLKETNNGQKTP